MDGSLLACPFCGNADPYVIESGERFYVACGSPDCYAALGEIWDRDAMPEHQFETSEDAIAAWNRRTPPILDQRDVEREALEALRPFSRAVGVEADEDGRHWRLLFPRSEPQPTLAQVFAARAILSRTLGADHHG